MIKINNNPYSKVCGFNYSPSYAAVLNDIFDHFDSSVIEKELQWAKQLGINSIRIWMSDVSFSRNENNFFKNFEKFLGIAAKNKMTVMPTFFNRWIDANWPIGQLDMAEALGRPNEVKKSYIKNTVQNFKSDERILMWDMCNEPFCYPFQNGNIYDEIFMLEVDFFRECVDICRSSEPGCPITVGYGSEYNPKADKLSDELSVMSCHPYMGWDDGTFEDFLIPFIEYSNKRNIPLVCTETCQGSLSDETRNECIKKSLGALQKYQMGWYAWSLCSGVMVSTRPDRTDLNALQNDRGYFPFILPDGIVRPGHEVIREFTGMKE